MSGQAAALERLAPLLAQLFTRPGYPFEGDDPAAHQVHFAWLLKSGQWAMVASQGRLLGWTGWYRCSQATFAHLCAQPLEHWVERGKVFVLDEGPYCYIAASVVAPWAPKNTYRLLYRLAAERNPDARMFGAHLVPRSGGRRFWSMPQERVGLCQSAAGKAKAAASP